MRQASRVRTSFLLGTLLLPSCGGDSGSGGSTAPTSTATATPTPTPTPTPNTSGTNSSLASLFYYQTFAGFEAGLTYEGNSSGSATAVKSYDPVSAQSLTFNYSSPLSFTYSFVAGGADPINVDRNGSLYKFLSPDSRDYYLTYFSGSSGTLSYLLRVLHNDTTSYPVGQYASFGEAQASFASGSATAHDIRYFSHGLFSASSSIGNVGTQSFYGTMLNTVVNITAGTLQDQTHTFTLKYDAANGSLTGIFILASDQPLGRSTEYQILGVRTAGANLITGTVGGSAGMFRAAFAGPNATELGGAITMTYVDQQTGASKKLVGSFAVRLQGANEVALIG